MSLIAIPQSTPIKNPYVNRGIGVTYSFTDFFIYTKISGSNLDCSYGDICNR